LIVFCAFWFLDRALQCRSEIGTQNGTNEINGSFRA